MLTQYFVSRWPITFLIVSQPLWFFMFFFLQNSSLLFSITRSSSFSVIYVTVNIKSNVEKDTTLLLFFLSKSPGGHAISFQIKPWVAFGLPYLLIELFYIGMPVVRTVGRCTDTWLPNFLVWVVHHFFCPWCSAARFARESSAITWPLGDKNFIFHEILSAREDKSRIPRRPCNVLFIL